MVKPIIGVVPLVDTEKESYWMLPGYMKGIEKAGGTPIMLPLTADRDCLEQLVDVCDGFLFTGGHDVSPSIYHEEIIKECGECSTERDEMESILFQLAYERNMPMFGICRGIQFFNAIMGGTLYQDLPTEYESSIEHHQSPPYDIPCHRVNIVENSPLYDIVKKDELLVNSYHHQAIKELAPGLVAMATADDGLIEAIYVPDKRFIWAVQWHPEFSYKVNETSLKLLSNFVENCKELVQC